MEIKLRNYEDRLTILSITKYVSCSVCGSVEFISYSRIKIDKVECFHCGNYFYYPQSVTVEGHKNPFQVTCGKFCYCSDCSYLLSCWGYFPSCGVPAHYNPSKSIVDELDRQKKIISADYLHLDKLSYDEWVSWCNPYYKR